ncbi:hypothetical [Yersinia pestis KIM10+]|uniref:Uncharacterized protein n=1 Tax=Yersinia pestis TaxID=632 RepID=Q8CLN0_YERPE|nr:hypothetical [Yersinia pestis KIM10+]
MRPVWGAIPPLISWLKLGGPAVWVNVLGEFWMLGQLHVA